MLYRYGNRYTYSCKVPIASFLRGERGVNTDLQAQQLIEGHVFARGQGCVEDAPRRSDLQVLKDRCRLGAGSEAGVAEEVSRGRGRPPMHGG